VFDNEEEMNRKEAEIVNEEFLLRDDVYNKVLGGEGGPAFRGHKHSEETKRHLSEVNSGYKHTEEARKKMSAVHKGKVISDEVRQKLSTASKGKKMSEEQKRKISESLKRTKAATKS
jgi:hypothetical protein